MNIIICGAGRVGFTIAKLLTEQNHSITVIDQSGDDIQKINDSLDVKAIVGKATSPSVLERANTNDADMIIAVTRNDEINMLICQIAYSLFKVPKKIARIRSQEYLDPKFSSLFNKENLPIDYVISPELEIAKSIQRKLEAPGALDNVPFAENKIRLLEISIDDKCPIYEIKLNDLTKKFPKLNAYILGVIRNEEFKILKKNDALKKDDKAYVMVSSNQMEETLKVFGHNEKISSKILIIGGGNIGFNLAKNLENSFEAARVKIIEKSKDRAELIANELNDTIVINGNGLDEDVLSEANLDEVETVLALTNDDEDNLMVSVLVEKFSKDKRTMALINKPNYSLLQSSLKIDDLIDPRMNTVSSILKHVHKGTIENAYTILNGEYEVIEAEILESSDLINKFELGLFDNPHVDEDIINKRVNTIENIEAGIEEQRRSIVLLENNGVLPLKQDTKIFVDGLDKNIAAQFGTLVEKTKDADIVIMYIHTVFNGNQESGLNRAFDNFLSTLFPNGDLNFNEEILDKVKKYSKDKDLIVVVDLNRPAILASIKESVSGLIGTFGVEDSVIFEGLYGQFNPSGRLPFEIPSSMKSVLNQKEDMPDDTSNPTYKYGYGASY